MLLAHSDSGAGESVPLPDSTCIEERDLSCICLVVASSYYAHGSCLVAKSQSHAGHVGKLSSKNRRKLAVSPLV